eukprot:3166368-Alexandrium_andersonii.AAC.1
MCIRDRRLLARWGQERSACALARPPRALTPWVRSPPGLGATGHPAASASRRRNRSPASGPRTAGGSPRHQ